jgi:hypothetical protein
MLAQSLRGFKKRDCALVWLEENRGETEAEPLPVFGLLFRSTATSRILFQQEQEMSRTPLALLAARDFMA